MFTNLTARTGTDKRRLKLTSNSVYSRRIFGLDLLRAVAILSVVYVHGSQYSTNPKAYLSDFPIAIDGVSIFFVLSGFLIGGILIRQLNQAPFSMTKLKQFWLRRWFRTLPNYFLVLSLLLTYRIVVLRDLWDFNLRYYLFSQNLFGAHPQFFPEAWSLSVEEWFYLLFPLFCYGLIRLNFDWSKALLFGAFIFLLFPLVLRIIKYELGIYEGSFDEEFRKIVVLRLDSLMYGILAAYWQFKSPQTWSKNAPPLLIFGLLLLLVLYLNPANWKNYYRPLYLNLESLATFLFLPVLSALKNTPWPNLDRLVRFISVISYSMYLLHLSPIQGHIIPIAQAKLGLAHWSQPENLWRLMALYWFLTFALSAIQYRFFEKPMTRLRERWAPESS